MIKFLYPTVFDSATVTSSSATTGYAAANVQTVSLKESWRSTGIASEWIKFDLGSAKSVDLFTFFYNNLTSSATVKLYAHASDLGTTVSTWNLTASLNQTVTFDNRVGVVNFTANQSYRYWMISFADATNSNAYLEIGRIFAGVTTSPTENFSENFNESVIDPSEQNFTIGDTLYSVARERYSVFTLTFQDITTANQTIIRDLFKQVYKTEPFVIAMDATGEPKNLTRYGVLTSDLNLVWTVNNRASISLTFRELR